MPFIVHPTDLSPTSEAAFLHALKLGLAAKAHLSLVHLHDVRSKEEPHKDDFPRVRDTLIRWGLLSEGATRAEVGDKLGLYLSKGMYLAGDPEAALTRLLRRSNTEFMVLSTRGLRGLRRIFDRSFSEELTRHAQIPTLIVPQDAIGFVDIDGGVRLANILAPIAEVPPCVPAIRAAVRICRLLGQKDRL